MAYMAALARRGRSLTRGFSASSAGKKLPILYRNPELSPSDGSEALTLQLFSWGRGGSGQLGGGVEETRMYPSPVASLLLRPEESFSLSPTPGKLDGCSEASHSKVHVGISCGLFHSAVIINGDLWIWGKGDGGRLGLGHENPLFSPTLNPYLEESSVRSIALGGLHSIALTKLGDLFSWGYGGFGALGHSVYHRELFPRLVEGSWSGKICHIATSGTHTAAITDTGELYTWGRDEGDGRLGLGPGKGPNEGGGMSIPSKVKSLPCRVAAVSCGGFFTMALTEDGQLWNWGANANYELGRGDKVGGWQPKPVASLEGIRIVQVAGGGYHSLALTDDGRVLSWGHGSHGQLGHPAIKNQRVPTFIESLAEEKIVHIACGGSTSAAISNHGKLYMWGNSKDFQLGVPGTPEIQPCPVEVKFLTGDDELGPHCVLSVAVGASHAMCLVARTLPSQGV